MLRRRMLPRVEVTPGEAGSLELFRRDSARLKGTRLAVPVVKPPCVVRRPQSGAAGTRRPGRAWMVGGSEAMMLREFHGGSKAFPCVAVVPNRTCRRRGCARVLRARQSALGCVERRSSTPGSRIQALEPDQYGLTTLRAAGGLLVVGASMLAWLTHRTWRLRARNSSFAWRGLP
jgi:hypothetical protein